MAFGLVVGETKRNFNQQYQCSNIEQIQFTVVNVSLPPRSRQHAMRVFSAP